MHGLTVLCQELDAAMTAGKLLLPTMDLLVLLQYRLRLEALLTFVAVEGSVGGHVIRQIVEAPPALLTARSTDVFIKVTQMAEILVAHQALVLAF